MTDALRFADLPPPARTVWAKSGDPAGHPLLAHLLDVAAVAERLLAREPTSTLIWAAAALELPGAVSRVIAAIVGLHDLGKALPGFQNKWPVGRDLDERAGLPFDAHLLQADHHDAASAKALVPLLAPHTGSKRRAQAFADAVAAHHGHVLQPGEVSTAILREPPPWPGLRQAVFDAYWSALAPDLGHETRAPAPAALLWLAGLTSVADWIGSSTEWFAPGERHETLAGHHADALRRADAALDAVGWPAAGTLDGCGDPVDLLVGRMLGGDGVSARALQRAGDELLRATSQPTLLVVEAPMGEGKTELAYLAHLRLHAALGHRGLFIGLPTQATGNAMFDRTVHFLRAFGHAGRIEIQLAHGGAALQDDRMLPLREISGHPGDTVASSAWFAQRRRPLLAPYGVGTIDQALLAGLNTKHHFVRLWGLANRVVVLDEVHAYDTYTSTLIAALLRWLKSLRCSVVLMSATLPTAKRDEFIRAWASDAAIDLPAVAYPRVYSVTAQAVQHRHFEARPLPTVQVAGVPESLDEIAEHVEKLCAGGGCGAVVVNTVDRAQQLYRRLQQRLAGRLEPMLFHARYPGDERQQRERQVLAAFGRDAPRQRAALLVATQVVEQSLDLDFDYLVSDLAPIDLLLQRAGRLHRHDRERPPAHREPRLTVAGIDGAQPPDLKTTKWVPVYDEWLLLRSWAVVRTHDRWHMPLDIDRLVQWVYGDAELPAATPPEVARRIDATAFGTHLGDTQQERQRALNAVLDATHRDLGDLFAGKPRGNDEGSFPGVRNVTRLGPDSVVAIPVEIDGDRWCPAPGESSFDPALPVTDAMLARRLVQRQVRLSRRELVQALAPSPLPAAFAEHPWLCHCRPLPLVAGCGTFGGLNVRLDPELGIVYDNDKENANDARAPAG